jgi:uncharacterized membrane protein YfcA
MPPGMAAGGFRRLDRAQGCPARGGRFAARRAVLGSHEPTDCAPSAEENVPITDPWFYVVAVPAVLVTGVSKGGFGGGLGIVAVPVLSLTIPPAQAVAIMAPILILMDAFGVQTYWRKVDRGAMAVMLPGAVVGIAAGGLLFDPLDAQTMRLVVGVLALAFVANTVLGIARARPTVRPARWFGTMCGGLAGFTSTIAHAGSPPAAFYLLPLRLHKTVFVASTVVFFAAVNLMKLMPYWLIGEFTGLNLATALVLAPLAPISMYLGFWLHHRIEQQLFMTLCYGLVALTGIKLILDGLGL